MKINDLYKGFRVLDVQKVVHSDSIGIYLRHEKSGLEVFHLLNDDDENLFAFAFRTPSQDSTGVAHVLEHSVLCGSKKFPVKDAFLQLSNQSMSTYLNAFTSADRTVFPASSLIKADYFNLMSVYSDAVFFPLLDQEIFWQEAWRLEHNDEGKPCIQGVVFNEMKGAWSSFNGVASDIIESSVLGGTCYKWDSGGDPLCIPDLTVEKVRAFHKKYYCTKNCLVFLYGNIPTEEQLDFLSDNVISRVNSFGKKASFPKNDPDFKIKSLVRATGPCEGDSEDEKKGLCSWIWRIGKEAEKSDLSHDSMELFFLCELIAGADSAPLVKSILDRFPGSDFSSKSGPSVYIRYTTCSFAFSGIEKKDQLRLRNAILESLEDIARNGINDDDLERTCLQFNVVNREVKRYSEPYSLTLLRKTLMAWTYGKSPFDLLDYIRETARVEEKFRSDRKYISRLIRKYFLDNENRSFVIVTPSLEWTKKRNQSEEKIAGRIYRQWGEKRLSETLDRMHEFQKKEGPSNIIPYVRKKDLKPIYENTRAKRSSVAGIPIVSCKQPTNRIVYASVNFPVDTLHVQLLKWLPILEVAFPDVGWTNLSWDKVYNIAGRCVADFGCRIRLATIPECSVPIVEKDPLVKGREWFSISFKFPVETCSEAFDFVSRFINEVSFDDEKRLETLFSSAITGFGNSLVQRALYYGMLRAYRKTSRPYAVRELVSGISSYGTFLEAKKMNHRKLVNLLSDMFARIRSSGAMFTVTADEEGLKAARRGFSDLAKKCSLLPSEPKLKQSISSLLKMTEIEGKLTKAKNPFCDEVFVIPGNIGFSTALSGCSKYDTDQVVADEILTHLMETTDLWNQVRTVGGAYGVFLAVNGLVAHSRFGTYRDPHPFDSLKFFEKSMKSLSDKEFTQTELDKAIAGVYSSEITPSSPSSKGVFAITNELYGITPDMNRRKIRRILSMNLENLKKACERFARFKFKGDRVILCGKSMVTDKIRQNSRKIINLPL